MFNFIRSLFRKNKNKNAPINSMMRYAQELQFLMNTVLKGGVRANIEVCHINDKTSVTAVTLTQEGGKCSIYLCSSYKDMFQHFGIGSTFDFDSKNVVIEGIGIYNIPNGFLLLKGKSECSFTERQAHKDFKYWFLKQLSPEQYNTYLQGLIEIYKKYS